MLAGELVEHIQRHFPDRGATEIINIANRVIKNISVRTGYGDKDYTSYVTAQDQMFYELDPNIVRISRAVLDGDDIPRLLQPPAGYLEDETSI